MFDCIVTIMLNFRSSVVQSPGGEMTHPAALYHHTHMYVRKVTGWSICYSPVSSRRYSPIHTAAIRGKLISSQRTRLNLLGQSAGTAPPHRFKLSTTRADPFCSRAFFRVKRRLPATSESRIFYFYYCIPRPHQAGHNI